MVLIHTSKPYLVSKQIYFEESQYFDSHKALASYIGKKMAYMFEYFTIKKGYVYIKLQDNIARITLLNGLNFILGFEQNVIEGEATAPHPVKLNRGATTMFIYASICAPMHVGGSMVPLLRTVQVKLKKNEAEFASMKNFIVRNPIYTGVSHSSINSIEVNIRSDSGNLFPFDIGSVTSLTLHLRKDHE